MKRPERRSIIEGGAVVVIGSSILILLPSQVATLPGLQTAVPPTVVPGLVGAALIVAGLGLVLQSALTGTTSGRIDWDRTAAIRIVTTVLLLIAYTAMFPRLGFLVTSALFIGFFAFFFGARNWVKVALLLVLTPLSVWLFFEKLFRIPLPHGLLY